MSAPNPYAVGAAAGLEVWAGLQQAEVIRMNADTVQLVNGLNAKYAEQDAFRAEQFGEEEIAAYEVQIDKTSADQKLAFSSQDVDVNFGTAKLVQDETKLTGFLNQLDIRRQARSNALGIRREARMASLSGAIARGAADVAARATEGTAILGAARTGLSSYTRK